MRYPTCWEPSTLSVTQTGVSRVNLSTLILWMYLCTRRTAWLPVMRAVPGAPGSASYTSSHSSLSHAPSDSANGLR